MGENLRKYYKEILLAILVLVLSVLADVWLIWVMIPILPIIGVFIKFLFEWCKKVFAKKLLSLWNKIKDTLPIKRPRWDERRNFLIWYDRFLLLAWVFYLITFEKNDLRPLLSSIFDEFAKINTFGIGQSVLDLKDSFKNYFFPCLLFCTSVKLLMFVISLITKRIYKYKTLPSADFPEYGFHFQSNLVKFLNKDNQIGDNIYWLDGAWGTGKTHFIRTFFEKQIYKVREIYYISCFGIKTRSQAEQVLLSEIEARSRLGVFSNIPVIGSLISWGFNASGLGLMKKDGVVIFDDLERVVYNPVNKDNDIEDNPADYNDLLGFIDYLANHKNQKVIVIYNSKEIAITQRTIIEMKFAPRPNVIDIPRMIDRICRDDSVLNYSIKTYLANFYELKWHINRNNVLRELKRDITKCQDGQMATGDIVIDLNKIIESSYIQDTFKRIEDYIKKDLIQYSPYELLKLKIEFKVEPNYRYTYYEYIEYVKIIHFSWISYIKVLSEFKNMPVQKDFKLKFIRTDSGLVQHYWDFSGNSKLEQSLNEGTIVFTVTIDDWKQTRAN